MNQMDPALKSLFEQVGISEKQLAEDKEMATFLYDFIEQNGGIEAVKKEQMARKPPPPLPVAPPSAGKKNFTVFQVTIRLNKPTIITFQCCCSDEYI